MNIELNNVVPVPLRDKVMARPSQVWNTQLVCRPGDRIKIKAPSGTGKTTLTHYLYNIRHDYTGAISYGGTTVRQITAERLSVIRQQQISIIFQDLRLFEHLTALENIELKRVMPPTPFCDVKRVHEMAETLRITHIMQQPARICSYGEQQRIAIIRALVQPFEWLIMDEPFSHLDDENAGRAARLIEEECNKRGAGFILTDLEEDRHFNYTRHLSL